LNVEIKRRMDVVAISNEAAIAHLAGALLAEQNDAWAVQRRHVTLETLEGLIAMIGPLAPPAATILRQRRT
jgi:hypothetical protein